MHNRVATRFDVFIKDMVVKEPFGDMSDTDCYGLIRNSWFSMEMTWFKLIQDDTCQGMCTADEQRFVTVQVRLHVIRIRMA